MNYYNQIKEHLINNEVYKTAKDFSKNRSDLNTYYNVGKLIVEAQGGEERAKYGDGLIKEHSSKLSLELGHKFNSRNLWRTRKFYLLFSDEKMSTLSTQLSWSHYVELMNLDSINKINYIDLLLFNYKYNCFVVVELMVTEFKAEYIGQIKKYMNYINKNIKSINQDKTIGIIICKKGNEFIMEYCSDDRIFETNFTLTS